MKICSLFIFLVSITYTFAQPNCKAYQFEGNTSKYEACKKAMEIKGHYQFYKEYQTILDQSIAIDSTFDYAYWAKSIAYLKSGDFLTWKQLIDKAVDLKPEEYLNYRGWCRYQFFRDYKGAIEDIEKFESMVDYDIGLSQNGTYHLNIAKGLCYKAIGDNQKAIKIIEDQIYLNEKQNFVGIYDYLHLGVLYLETDRYHEAINMFEKQSQANELADNQYYLALTQKKMNNLIEYKSCLEKAKELYLEGKNLFDYYSNPMDKIYFENIENELVIANTIQ